MQGSLKREPQMWRSANDCGTLLLFLHASTKIAATQSYRELFFFQIVNLNDNLVIQRYHTGGV